MDFAEIVQWARDVCSIATGAQLLAMAQADPRCRYAYIIGNGPYVHVDVY